MRVLTAACFLVLALKMTDAKAAAAQTTDNNSPALKRAEASITQAHLLQHIKELSSDAYTGRAPGTDGEARSVAYIVSQCRAIGLQPGSPDGSWVQKVPLWGMLTRGTVSLKAKGKDIPLAVGKDYVAGSTMPVPKIDLSSGVVFVGYGVVAPKYRWDDYAGTDVHGKTVIILAGDPPVADAKDLSKLDETMFLGRALTIYGRTGTKLETAYKHGAAAVILVSPTPQALASLFQNFTRENLIVREPHDRDRVTAQAIVGEPVASKFFSAAGEDFETLRAAAAKPDFHAVLISGTASFDIITRVRQIDSSNVIAKIPGSDPQLRNQYVIYSAHWDHHGQVGKDIYHGASDNAAGTAGVLELARAFQSMHPAPWRTLLFLWPTAEEKGLVGAHYYVEHPLYPLQQTIADINLDYFSNWGWGRTHDFSIVGIGNSTLDDMTAAAVHAQGRVLTGDTAPEQGFYFRSDHYEFARVGVPSLETSPGIDYVGKPVNFGTQKRNDYISHDYHQPSDVIKPGWDLSGAVEDLQVVLDVGYRVAQDNARPAWKSDAIWRPKPE
jgi:Zn-dependent M28 family amino/carboxypeptidase